MGGRGASSGTSITGKRYGTEYTTLYQVGNIKFVKQNADTSIKTPIETMAKRRTYVTIGEKGQPKSITQYSKKGKRRKQIDINGKPHKIESEWVIPHTHKGYWHDEKGTYKLSEKERKLVDYVVKLWENKKR